jgi:hypothetical protein
MAKDQTNDSIKQVDAGKVGNFDPTANYTSTGPGGSEVNHKGCIVTGDLDAAVNRSTTASKKS